MNIEALFSGASGEWKTPLKFQGPIDSKSLLINVLSNRLRNVRREWACAKEYFEEHNVDNWSPEACAVRVLYAEALERFDELVVYCEALEPSDMLCLDYEVAMETINRKLELIGENLSRVVSNLSRVNY